MSVYADCSAAQRIRLTDASGKATSPRNDCDPKSPTGPARPLPLPDTIVVAVNGNCPTGFVKAGDRCILRETHDRQRPDSEDD